MVLLYRSNTKLLPKFLFELALAFKNNNYANKLEEIKKLQGTKSDDDNAYVDKYSGYEICDINFEVQEQYTGDGMKIISRGVIDEDVTLKTKQEVDKPLYQIYIENVLQLLIRYLRIEINEHENLITNIIFYIKNKTDILDENKDRGRSTYERYRDENIIMYTVAYFTIELQNQIPHHIPSVQLPGCTITQFLGAKNKEETIKDIKYFACLLLLIRNKSAQPWSSIFRLNRENLEKKLLIAYGLIYKNMAGLEGARNNKLYFLTVINI